MHGSDLLLPVSSRPFSTESLTLMISPWQIGVFQRGEDGGEKDSSHGGRSVGCFWTANRHVQTRSALIMLSIWSLADGEKLLPPIRAVLDLRVHFERGDMALGSKRGNCHGISSHLTRVR